MSARDMIICDDGGGSLRGWGLYMMAPIWVTYERHAVGCRPGMWTLFIAGALEITALRCVAQAVVDDFGSLVIVSRDTW